jgi:poly(hydroxyalkanoate) granule-associated protein
MRTGLPPFIVSRFAALRRTHLKGRNPMVKKLKQMADKKAASTGRLLDGALAGQVKDSAQQIWLAGMGAFSRAQAEGTKVFEALVKEGASLQKKTQSAAEEKLSGVTSKMTSMAGDVQAKAGQHWDKLESIFEERTAKALNKLGVPSAKDVNALISRIDELSAKVAKLSKTTPAKTPAPRIARIDELSATTPPPAPAPASRSAAPKKAAASAKKTVAKRVARKSASA